MTRQIPKRLGKDTIVEAIWEIRFTGGTSTAEILPGVVYQMLSAGDPNLRLRVEKLPPSQLPQNILENEPSLRYAPQVSLVADDYSVQIGNHVASVSFGRPYPGWKNTSETILKLAPILKSTNMLGEVERFSLRYTDVIPDDDVRTLDGLVVNLQLGEISLSDKTTHLRTELPQGEFLHIIQIGRPADLISQRTGERSKGTLVDIDTIAVCAEDDFWSGFPSRLERAHDASKTLFFSLLTLETEASLEPEY